jgi:glycosyltransferase involved in cell wall biosynthesis
MGYGCPRVMAPGSILMLVPHDPEHDPRIMWTIDLCASILPTTVLAVSTKDERPRSERRGRAVIERLSAGESVMNGTPGTSPAAIGTRLVRRMPIPRWVRDRRQAVHHFTTNSGYFSRFGGAIMRRAAEISVSPTVIVCHDVYVLSAALRLGRGWGAKVLYDSHEYWPEADLMSERWEEFLLRVYEGRLIRRADRVVTVSPPLARLLERTYRVKRVIAVPNACPSEPQVSPSASRPLGVPVRFLLQGQASPRRGFEELIAAWRLLNEPRTLLEIRCPENAYLQSLRTANVDLERQGRLRFLPAVPEDQLIAAAAEADVGLVPYPGHTLNHIYACPNKLAQYMHAGLAVLSNDLAYIRSVVSEYQCGAVFDIDRPQSLVNAVLELVGNPEQLQAMKEASVRAARTFNWEIQSKPYRMALRELAGLPTI